MDLPLLRENSTSAHSESGALMPLMNSLVIWDVGKAHHHVLFDASSFSLLHNQILLIPSIPLHLLFLTSPVSGSPRGSYIVT